MAKKTSHRKPTGVAAIETIEDDVDPSAMDSHHESNGDQPKPSASRAKSKPAAPAKTDQASDGHVGVGDVKKAAAFVNSIGGLDKAIAILQILKVAKEVQ
jgi:hypothetical protein